eukprot:m.147468 g.147468  ORF g.147468 m.147468 type:complete len:136 (+) comp16261_c0_seq3:908-1315(+)
MAARGALKKLLAHARAAQSRESTAGRNARTRWNLELQRTVLEQVLRENRTLAERLQLQQEQATSVPDEFLCPITCGVMEDPVVDEDGQTYEREAIDTWVTRSWTSPMTRQQMTNRFIPNRNIKNLIERWQLQLAE